jgi:hypothetical protein
MATYMTAEQIQERNLAIATVIAKAASAPESLTDEDLSILPGEVSSRLMSEGKLKHLGIGQPKSSWKRRS